MSVSHRSREAFDFDHYKLLKGSPISLPSSELIRISDIVRKLLDLRHIA